MSAPASSAAVPVVVFAYRRPDHLRRTIESLQRNPEFAGTPLIVYCDAAKLPEHAAEVARVRAYAHAIEGCASLKVVEREANLGLARSIISGVSEVLETHEQVIVLEDDLLLSPHCLRYMLDGLATYAADPEVASIHGYSYPVASPLPETFFLKGADCWGWATWRRAWQYFRADGAGLLAELQQRGLDNAFDFDGSYPFTRMLRDQVAGRNDSWAIRWNASCFLAGMLTLYPGRSLVHNIGNDASGTHAADRDDFAQRLAERRVVVERQPLMASDAGREAFVAFFRAQQPGVLQKAARLVQRWRRAVA
jgi:hypothetical protein